MSNPFAKSATKPKTATPAEEDVAPAPSTGNLKKEDPAKNKDPFARPSTSDQSQIREDMGSLLVLRMVEYKPSVDTVHGETSAVEADWLVCDGDNAGEIREGGLIFNRPLVRKLKDLAPGALFVARLEKGTAKPGKQAPYIFVDCGDDEIPHARECAESVGWL